MPAGQKPSVLGGLEDRLEPKSRRAIGKDHVLNATGLQADGTGIPRRTWDHMRCVSNDGASVSKRSDTESCHLLHGQLGYHLLYRADSVFYILDRQLPRRVCSERSALLLIVDLPNGKFLSTQRHSGNGGVYRLPDRCRSGDLPHGISIGEKVFQNMVIPLAKQVQSPDFWTVKAVE